MHLIQDIGSSLVVMMIPLKQGLKLISVINILALPNRRYDDSIKTRIETYYLAYHDIYNSMRFLQKSPFCHSRRDSERESGSKCLKNHIRPRMLLSGIEEFGDDKQFCKSLYEFDIMNIIIAYWRLQKKARKSIEAIIAVTVPNRKVACGPFVSHNKPAMKLEGRVTNPVIV